MRAIDLVAAAVLLASAIDVASAQTQFESAKLGLASGATSPLNRSKSISRLGFICANLHPKGLQFSEDGSYWSDMPMIERGTLVGTAMRSSYDEQPIEFPQFRHL